MASRCSLLRPAESDVGLYQRKQLATIVDRDRTRAALLHSYILCILVGGLVMAFAAPVDNFGFTAR